jgi:adenylate kinase family enzyme
MAELRIILGVPASGKTTLARRLAADRAPHTAS